MKKKKIGILCLVTVFVCLVIGGVAVSLLQRNKLCTITFDVNGGTEIVQSLDVKSGETIELPQVEREGYTLDGWYYEKTLWTNKKIVKKNMVLTARWSPKIYRIEFVIDDTSYYEYVNHGEMPNCPVQPEKDSTISKTYSFSNWYPKIKSATEDCRYTAQFDVEVREYNIQVVSTHDGACSVVGAGNYEYNSDATIKVEPQHGYVFDGWYDAENNFVSSDCEISVQNITSDIVLKAKFTPITKTITYFNEKGSVNNNPINYDVRNGEISLSKLSCNGYEFIGWFTQPSGLGDLVETINSSLLQDYSLYAHWQLITYTITYKLYGGINNVDNPLQYTIESGDILLKDPTKDSDSFLGWRGTELDSTTTTVLIKSGSYGDREYSAVWAGGAYKLSFVVDGEEIDECRSWANAGDKISEPNLDAQDLGMSGYKIDGWYTDNGLTNKYEFSNMPDEDLCLYASWDYYVNDGFLPYYSEFRTVVTSSTTLFVDSYGELVAWVEFVEFYDITTIYTLKINYGSFTRLGLEAELSSARSDSKYHTNGGVAICALDSSTGYVIVSTSYRQYELKGNMLVVDEAGEFTYSQLDYAQKIQYSQQRDTEYNDFKINNVADSLVVSTSNQLVYALEMGYRPIVEVGSSAEEVYEKAKDILISICDDSMTDYEKSRAIYEWLIINVEYDNKAVEGLQYKSNWGKYDSWYAEGALLNGVAVCDGIAKAFLIMAKIENIPTIKVVSEDHAWNKVLIDGNWYGIDATHGNILLNVYEVVNYTQFLFTDEFKDLSNVATNYREKIAETEFDYYSSFGNDFVADSQTEFDSIISKAKVVAPAKGYSFDVIINFANVSYDSIFSILSVSTYSTMRTTHYKGYEVLTIIIK